MPEPEDRPYAAVGSPGLTLDAHRDGGRVLVAVSGELGLEADEALRGGLRTALADADEGVDLDLSEVAFCDCSGLNTLLALREQALGEGKAVRVRAVSTVVERLLFLTGTRSLFAPAYGVAGDDSDAGDDERDGGDDERGGGEIGRELGVEVVQLRRAMRTRPTIDLARGVLMASFGLSPQDAWEVLVEVSQRTNTKLYRLADELLDAVQGATLPEPLRREVAAAVARLATGGEDDGTD
ncbi:ANTAR domain-containing protein [Streptomyces sp. NPDC001595]|uniref:ANTAR domain-containing protein n=1 Tax=Streptomyces sp. NPDC001532 TaxID=3154520 RepID=UPI003328EE2C